MSPLFIGVATIVIVAFIILVRDLRKSPNEEEEIDDPTTTCWHDDDFHPDSKL